MKIGIGIPNGDDFKSEAVAAMMLMASQISAAGHEFSVITVQSCYVDRNRNEIMAHAKRLGVDWLLFLDTDVAPVGTDDIIGRITNLEHNVVTGIYYGGVYPYRPVIFNFKEDCKLELLGDTPAQPFYVDATGGGFLLISKKVIDAFTDEVRAEIGEPWDFLYDGRKLVYREDLAFCWRLKHLGFKVLADPTIKLSHMKKHAVGIDHWAMARNHMATIDAVPDGVPGWTTAEELAALAGWAKECESVAEIGSWKGRSTKELLASCPGTVYAVDHWQGSDSIKAVAMNSDVYGEFLRNVGHFENLKVYKMPSLEAAGRIEDIDMVFIDGAHDYESVKADIAAWLPKARKIICGHDYAEGWPGVKKAVDEMIPDKKVIGTLWYKEIS